jgi:hypothetical protein
MGFNGVLIIDDDILAYTYDSDPSQYRSALIAQECLKNGMMFAFEARCPAVDPDDPSFRNSFGPHLQALANYFKQFSNFYGLQFDDWAAIGTGLKVDNYVEWDSWLRSQFDIGRSYWITYDDSFYPGNREKWASLFGKITQPYTNTMCYYSQTFDPSWIDTFATGYPWANYPNHKLGLIVSSWRYSDAPSQWSPDTIRPWIEAALKYPLFKSFQYFGWRLSSPNQDTEWTNDLAAHPEWFSAITAINAEITGSQPPPSTGTLRVFASYQGSYIAATVSVTGPESKTGFTTTDPNNPLRFEVTPGSYTVSGTYESNPQSKTVTVVVGQTVDVNLNFGGASPKSLWDQIVDFITQHVDSRFLFLGGILVFGVALWLGNKRLSKRAKKRKVIFLLGKQYASQIFAVCNHWHSTDLPLHLRSCRLRILSDWIHGELHYLHIV